MTSDIPDRLPAWRSWKS